MNSKNKNLILSALFIAVGFVLPFFTGQIQSIGKMLLPMHIPVLLCGIICGWKYGAFVGFVLPIFRAVTLGMPPLFPVSIAMAFELATYGAVIGYLYNKKKTNNFFSLMFALTCSMVIGRLVWGAAQFLLLGVTGTLFTAQMFIAGALTSALPGIILQLVLIPSLIMSLEHIQNIKQKEPKV